MRGNIIIILCLLCLFTISAQEMPALKRSETLRYADLVNDYFMRTYPDVGATSHVGGKTRNSRIWTRGVYYEGLMAFYREYPQEKCLKYAVDWGKFHNWKTTDGSSGQSRHADFQCCGQAYLDLYMLDPVAERKAHAKQIFDAMMVTERVDDWYWIDAIQMAMPIFAQLGSIEKDESYFKRMYEMYMFTRDEHGGNGRGGGLPLFNEKDGLWYRDYQFDPPYMDLKETDKPCYWSRGNGWVYAALARVLYYSPDTVYQRDQYIRDFKLMSEALLKCQREDGFWGVSLAAPTNTGDPRSPGPETSGTALFVMGMAYGINEGILDRETYLESVIRGWNALCKTAVHEDTGFLGYVQGTGSAPEHGQPVLFNSTPDFEDYGIGCFLLAAAEVYRLGDVDLSTSSPQSNLPENSLICYVLDNSLKLNLTLQKENFVSIDIYDIRGILKKQVYKGALPADKHSFDVSTEGLSGLHVCVVKTTDSVISRKILVL